MNSAGGVAATPVDDAMTMLNTVFDRLLDEVEAGGLDHYDTLELVGFAQSFERFRNRLSLVDHRLIRDSLDRDLPQALTQTSIQRVLTQALRISPGEASRRVRAADQLETRATMSGTPLEPQRPVLAAAQRSGNVNPEQADVIVRGLAKVDLPGYDPADLHTGEALLTTHASLFGPGDLRLLTHTVVDRIDPDGSRPRDDLNHHRRHLELRPSPDGTWHGEFRLTGPVGAKLAAILNPLTKPRTNVVTGPDGRPVEHLDPRSRGQRLHDALNDVCDRLLRADDLPDSGGTPTTVIVTIDYQDLITRTGHGTTNNATTLTAQQILHLADQADIIPTVLNSAGAVLSLGRSRRIASRNQTLALYARDNGCSFPGCDHPPPWCERHHIQAWIDDGPTNLDNLTLLCSYHHHNFANHGWNCQLDNNRLPTWTPPAWIDPTQTPITNHRILARQAKQTIAA